MLHNKFVFLILALIISASTFSQSAHGIVVEGEQMESKILGRAVKYTFYLPPGYTPTGRLYPVVYLLHGYTGNDADWVQFGTIDQIVDKAIINGDLPPMIIVTPDGGNNFYINSYDGKTRYEDMFIEEFLPHFENKFNIRKKKEFRGIAGLSMGGFGSLIMALKHTELFTACAPLSAAIFSDEQFMELAQDRYDALFGDLFGEGQEGEERLTPHYESNSVLHLVTEIHADSIKSVRYYIDCGDDDYLTVGNSELHVLMTKKEIPHEYRVRDGGHTWEYWRTGLVDALKFISESFTR